jgi:hypothetical protein
LGTTTSQSRGLLSLINAILTLPTSAHMEGFSLRTGLKPTTFIT